MRIGHYAPNIAGRGGIGTYVRQLMRAQVEAGHTVVGFGFAGPPKDAPWPYHRLRGFAELFEQSRRLMLDVLHLHRKVSSLPDERVPTLRTTHGHGPSCPSGSRYLSRQGVPCDRAYSVPGCLWGHVVDRCGSIRPRKLRLHFQRTRQEMDTLSRMPVHTVSQFLKEKMVESGYAPGTIRVLHSPAPAVKAYVPPPAEGTPRFVFLGRLVPQKGVDWFLKAAARMDAPFHLDIAGEGYERTALEKLAARLGIANRVTFHGWVEADQAEGLLRAARAVVFPSVWHEPAGLVSLEAAAAGRALIGGRVGGLPEYATPEYALLAPPHDVAGLAEHMTRLAEDRDLAAEMGRQGRRLAQTRFGMDHFLSDLDALYDTVIAERRGLLAQ